MIRIQAKSIGLPLPEGIQAKKEYDVIEQENGYLTTDGIFIPNEMAFIINRQLIEHIPKIDPIKKNIINDDKISQDIRDIIIKRMKEFKEKYQTKIKDEEIFWELFRNELEHVIDKHL